MDLTRGICIFCGNPRIINCSREKWIGLLLKNVLDGQIDNTKFLDVSNKLKICPSCVHNILTLSKFKDNNLTQGISEYEDKCSLCLKNEHLVFVQNWLSFSKMLENVMIKNISKCCICLYCFKCLDLLEKVKTHLLNKYPFLKLTGHLKIKNKKSEKENKHSFHKSLDQKLKHLCPLKSTSFNLNQFEKDNRLYEQIPFVKLDIMPIFHKNTNGIVHQNTGIVKKPHKFDIDRSKKGAVKHSFFKIKLKASKKVHFDKLKRPLGKTYKIIPDGHSKELYVKLSRMKFSDKEGDRSEESPPDTVNYRSEAQKRVSFSDVLSIEIKEEKKHNVNGSPLKSLLKKSNTCSDVVASTNSTCNDIDELKPEVSEELTEVHEGKVEEADEKMPAVLTPPDDARQPEEEHLSTEEESPKDDDHASPTSPVVCENITSTVEKTISVPNTTDAEQMPRPEEAVEHLSDDSWAMELVLKDEEVPDCKDDTDVDSTKRKAHCLGDEESESKKTKLDDNESLEKEPQDGNQEGTEKKETEESGGTSVDSWNPENTEPITNSDNTAPNSDNTEPIDDSKPNSDENILAGDETAPTNKVTETTDEEETLCDLKIAESL